MKYDLKTKNQSFRDMRFKLQDEGIENNSFMLATINEKLIGLDIEKVLKSNADESQKNEYYDMILDECKQNVWYFFREIVRIPVYTGNNEYGYCPRFTLNILNLEMIWCYEHNIPFLAKSPRQTGRSITLDLLYIHALLVKHGKPDYRFLAPDIKKMKRLLMTINRLMDINSYAIPSLSLYMHQLNNNDNQHIITNTSESDDLKNHVGITDRGRDVIRGENIFCYEGEYFDKLMDIIATEKSMGFVCAESSINRGIERNLGIYIDYMMPRFNRTNFFDMTTRQLETVKQSGIMYLIVKSYVDLGYSESWVEQMKSILQNNDAFKSEVLLQR